MNRSLLIAILIIVVAGGIYYYSQGNKAMDATGDMIEKAADTAESAGQAATDAAEGAADAVTETAQGAADAVNEAMDGTLLTVEGYDPVKVAELIDGSALDDNQKNSFKNALMAASDDPALLTDILGQVKAALGM